MDPPVIAKTIAQYSANGHCNRNISDDMEVIAAVLHNVDVPVSPFASSDGTTQALSVSVLRRETAIDQRNGR
jgi:hypothetical protein